MAGYKWEAPYKLKLLRRKDEDTEQDPLKSMDKKLLILRDWLESIGHVKDPNLNPLNLIK